MGEKQGHTDPFVTGRFGGSQRMATDRAVTCSGVTTAAERASALPTCSSGQVTRSSLDPRSETLFSCGAAPFTDKTRKQASNARSSETRVRSSRRSLSDRLTRSLITSGLVCGITPLSIRQLSGQPIRVLAFDTPTGPAAASPEKAFSSSSAPERLTGEDSPANEGEGAL